MINRTRVKFCGITRVEDAIFAAKLAVDAVGLVFYSKSSRYVSIDTAAEIISVLPPFVSVVGLFVDANHSDIERLISRIPLNILQFHGNETPDYCASFSLPYLKAIRMSSQLDVSTEIERYNSATGILLDSYNEKQMGGSGETFDWVRVPKPSKVPIILAGGLDSSNVVQAISETQAYAVDVSSGIESSGGIKDNDKMTNFINEVNLIGSK